MKADKAKAPEHGIEACPVCGSRTLYVTNHHGHHDERYGEHTEPWAALRCFECGRWLATLSLGEEVWTKQAIRLSSGQLLVNW